MTVSESSAKPGAAARAPGFRILCSAMLSLALLFASSAHGQQAGRPRTGGTVVLAGGSDLQSMNSLVNSDAWTAEFINNAMFLPLLRFREDLTYEPALAQSWRVIGDTAVVFKLRHDVKWHDGLPTTAYDVAFTFARVKDPETAFPNGDYFDRWESAQVIDSFTIRFRIKPQVEPLTGWALTAIMPQHLLDSIPSARMRQAAFNKHPVGNGPFRFVSQAGNDRWIFEANPNFPRALGGRPYLDRVVWRVIPDNNAQLTALVTGEADFANGARAEQAREWATRPGFKLMLRQTQRYAMITWNGKHAPLGDARVRRALTMALNRPQIIQVLRGGFAQPASSPIPPSHWAFDKSVTPLPFDPAGARALLAQAGYVDRNHDGTVERADGQPLQLELMVAAGNTFNRDVGEMVRANLADVGVKVTVRPTDFPILIQSISSPEHKFDGAFLMFSTDVKLGFTDAFHSKAIGGPFQSASYSNPELDRLLDRAAVVRNRGEATRIWHRVQRILRDDQPWSFLWWAPDMILMRNRVNGVEMDVRGALRTLPRWWVSDSPR